MKKTKDDKFQCGFCHTRFKLESRFMSHRCKEMQRDEEIRTPIGQAAWSYYQKWMKSNRRAVPPIETFLSSRYYTTFVKFARFVNKVGLPDVNTFIWYMKEKDVHPMLWYHNDTYVSYLEFIDNKSDPYQQAKQTINFLFQLADALEVDVSEVFNNLQVDEIITMLHRRQLSPWILLHSGKFKQFLIEKTNDQQKIALQAIIRPNYWAEKKKKNPEVVAQMKKYVQELNL